jgi:hypothetical protein
MSTIQSQVKKNIFNKFKIIGFVSLVRSSELLKDALVKMGVFNPEQEIIVDDEPIDIIEIQVGNGTKIFNSNNSIDFYTLITKDKYKYPLNISVKHFHAPELLKNLKTRKNGNRKKEKLLEFEIIRFFPSKDPP